MPSPASSAAKYLIEASPRQRHMFRKQLRAGNNARLAEGWQPHGLRRIELRVLEGSETNEAADQRGREARPINIDAISQEPVRSFPAADLRSAVRFVSVMAEPSTVRRHHRSQGYANAQNTSLARLRGDQPRHFSGGHPADCGQIRPLIREWAEIVVDKYAVAVFSRFGLKRQGDQIAEAAGWHGILARKETVIGIETDIRASDPSLAVTSNAPRRRASAAGTGSAKKIQA